MRNHSELACRRLAMWLHSPGSRGWLLALSAAVLPLFVQRIWRIDWAVQLLLWTGPLIFWYFRSRWADIPQVRERFATANEIRRYQIALGAPEVKDALVVGTVWTSGWRGSRASWVAFRIMPNRPEIGHGLVVAPTGLGKGLALVSQLLLNTAHSAIVLDLKGEAFRLTSGAREEAGQRVLRIDLGGTGSGHRYDPTAHAEAEDDLRVIAQALTYDPQDRDPFWAHAAEELLTACMLAARRVGHPVFPFLRSVLDCGIKGAHELLRSIDPALATRFLPGGSLDSKVMTGVWMTLSVRLRPLLTDRLVAVLGGTDFDVAQLRKEPTTIYITVPEAHLERLAPALTSVWTGLIGEIIAQADDASVGVGLRPLLLLLDEAGRIPIPRLPGYLATLRSRGVIGLLYVQSFSQLCDVYGPDQARSISNNCALHIFYQQHDEITAWAVSRRLGEMTGVVHGWSVTEAGLFPGGGRVSLSAVERPQPLLSTQQILRLPEETVLVFYRDLRPLWIGRLDWRAHPVLRAQTARPPVALPCLSPRLLPQHLTHPTKTGKSDAYWDPDR